MGAAWSGRPPPGVRAAAEPVPVRTRPPAAMPQLNAADAQRRALNRLLRLPRATNLLMPRARAWYVHFVLSFWIVGLVIPASSSNGSMKLRHQIRLQDKNSQVFLRHLGFISRERQPFRRIVILRSYARILQEDDLQYQPAASLAGIRYDKNNVPLTRCSGHRKGHRPGLGHQRQGWPRIVIDVSWPRGCEPSSLARRFACEGSQIGNDGGPRDRQGG